MKSLDHDECLDQYHVHVMLQFLFSLITAHQITDINTFAPRLVVIISRYTIWLLDCVLLEEQRRYSDSYHYVYNDVLA